MRTITCVMWVLLACSACGSEPAGTATPVSPTAAAAAPNPLNAYVGAWSGNSRLISCTGSSRFLRCSPVGTQSRFALRIARSGAGLVGLLGATLDLVGALDANGGAAFTGGDEPVTYELGRTLVESMAVRLTDQDTLEGEISVISYPPTAISEVGPVRTTAVLSAGTRQPEALDEPFTGMWTGWFEEVFTGRSFFIDPVRDLSLSLVQTGTAISGTMTMTFMGTIPLSGRADGDRAVLTGEIAHNGVTVRVVDFNIQRSAVGRLTGSYRLDFPTARPEFRLARLAWVSPS